MRIPRLPFALFFVIAHAGFAQPSNTAVAVNPPASNSPSANPLATNKAAPQNRQPDQGQTEKTHTPEWVGNAIALINVLVVFYIFWRTETSNREDRRRERVRSVKLFWVQDLILNPNIAGLHDFFNKYEEEMERITNTSTCPSAGKLNQIAEAKVLAFKKDHNIIRRKVIHPLLTVSPNFERLKVLFSQIEDLVTKEYTRIPAAPRTASDATTTPVESFRELCQQFFAELHRGQMLLADSQ